MSDKKPARIQVRRSPVDGMWRRWEQRSALSLNLVTPEQIRLMEAVDALVPVCTGVFRTRAGAFR